MEEKTTTRALLIFAAFGATLLSAQVKTSGEVSKGPGYSYKVYGNPKDIVKKAQPGFFLAGGGDDLDDGFRWMCRLSGGGDFLVLRATGDDAYNPYISSICPQLNSVATLVISSSEGANQPFVAEKLRNAEAIFISGGDQSQYIRWWKGTAVQDILNGRIAAGVPVGGTSAGLDVLGEFIYSALHDTVTTPEALANPFHERVTLDRKFLSVPFLSGILTDAHVAERNRLGRDVAFLARILEQGWTYRASGIFIDEKTAVLLRPDGRATVIGPGHAYFVRASSKPEICQPGKPLTFRNLAVYRAGQGGFFDLSAWRGGGGSAYQISAENGVMHSTQSNGSVY
jgi:cyanophycinase